MSAYQDIVLAIVREQENIIGPVALEQANSISGLVVNFDNNQVEISGDPQTAITKLVEGYRQLFGNISVDVCKSVVHRVAPNIAQDELPAVLRG